MAATRYDAARFRFPDYPAPEPPRTGPQLGQRLQPPSADQDDSQIALPNTATRTTPGTWIKLLTRVDRKASGGFGFEGTILRPGARIALSQLPGHGLVLECAGAIGPGWGHKRKDALYILWKWHRERKEWRDVAQARSVNSDWAMALRPIAAREMADPEEKAAAIDPVAVADRVMCLLEVELEDADCCGIESVLAVLHDRLAARSVKLYRTAG